MKIQHSIYFHRLLNIVFRIQADLSLIKIYIILLQSLIAVAMVLYGTIDSLIDFFSFTAWIFYGGAMLALIVMRYTKPHAPRPYKVGSYFNDLFIIYYNACYNFFPFISLFVHCIGQYIGRAHIY